MWYLLRHPQTELNKQQKYHGWGFAPYSDLGEKQFKKSIEFASGLKADVVLSSDLKRCQMLAKRISQVKEIPLIKSPLLRELNFGEWHGYTYDYLSKKYKLTMKRWVDDPWNNAPLNGETLKQLKQRCEQIKQIYDKQNAIVVTHGGVIAIFQYLIKQIEYWKLLPKNTDCVQIDWQEKKIDIINI